MKYHLDRTIRFATEQEFQNLYRWSLQEFSSAGHALGTKQIPWMWSLYFTGTDMTLHHLIEVEREAQNSAVQPKNGERVEITLAPEQRRHTATRYSMFGTDRTIKAFTLTVRNMQTEDRPSCTAWGFPSYTTEADENFSRETVDDTLGFELTISEREFAALRLAAQQGTGDYGITFAVSGVHGLYADWSPGITTSAVKVLAGGPEQTLVIPEGVGPLPRLGEVGEGKLYLARRSALSLFNRSTDTEEPDGQKAEPKVEQTPLRTNDQNESKILAGIDMLQKAVARLRLPMWLLLVVAIAILLSHSK